MTATTGDSALSITAEGRPLILNEAGFLDGSDCVVTARICRQLGEDVVGDAALALAFAVRAVRDGSTAPALGSVAALAADVEEEDEGDVDSEPPTVGEAVELPDPGAWLDTVRSSALVTAGLTDDARVGSASIISFIRAAALPVGAASPMRRACPRPAPTARRTRSIV